MAETEAVLLKRFTGSGDAEAFAEIIRRHAGLVYGAALRILADVDRASDVAQETFLQLTKDAGHVTGSLPGWLHRVATHKAIDELRRDASRRHRESAVCRPRATARRIGGMERDLAVRGRGAPRARSRVAGRPDSALSARPHDPRDCLAQGRLPGNDFPADWIGGRAASRQAAQTRYPRGGRGIEYAAGRQRGSGGAAWPC